MYPRGVGFQSNSCFEAKAFVYILFKKCVGGGGGGCGIRQNIQVSYNLSFDIYNEILLQNFFFIKSLDAFKIVEYYLSILVASRKKEDKKYFVFII